MRKSVYVLMILMCVIIQSVTLSSSPSKPSATRANNARAHYLAWKTDTISQAKDQVDNAFEAVVTVINDYKNANASIREIAYSSLASIYQQHMVIALMKAFNHTRQLAESIASSMTLAGTVESVISNHGTKLSEFNELWDEWGTVTQDYVYDLIDIESRDGSNPGGQANSLMEAFYRYEYAAGVYNALADAWNDYRPPDEAEAEAIWLSDPIKPQFTRIGCFNDCGDLFDTFTDSETSHQKKCGTEVDVEKAAIKSLKDAGGFYEDPVAISREVDDILKRRSVSKGCGRVYYDCPQIPDTEHKVRTCNKWVYRYDAHLSTRPPAKSKCVEPYRRCMGHTFDHNNRVLGSSKHSDDGSDSTEEANTGGTTPTPTMHACNIHDASDSGSHTSYTCNISPCSGLIWWGCVDAQCPETDTHGKVVCTISGCQDSTPYDPTSSSAGLHAYHSECSQYKCNGVDHSWQTSCTDTTHTNSNGDSCTVAGYECVSHTPVYPAPPPTTVSCGGCSVSYDPQGSLAWRHEYIPCPRTRIAHDLSCGASFYRCSNTNTCIWNWRHSSWNDDPEL